MSHNKLYEFDKTIWTILILIRTRIKKIQKHRKATIVQIFGHTASPIWRPAGNRSRFRCLQTSVSFTLFPMRSLLYVCKLYVVINKWICVLTFMWTSFLVKKSVLFITYIEYYLPFTKTYLTIKTILYVSFCWYFFFYFFVYIIIN